MSCLLLMDKINALPQPLFVQALKSDPWWPVESIDVQTGLMRIDVCGLLECCHFADFRSIKDADGREYEPDTFYNEDGESL